MNNEIPVDATQDIIDKMNARRYRKATPKEVLEFQKYPGGLPRTISCPLPLMEKTTGLIWSLTKIGHPDRRIKGDRGRIHVMKAEPWRFELNEEIREIWGDRQRLAEQFEAPELASCPALWIGFGI